MRNANTSSPKSSSWRIHDRLESTMKKFFLIGLLALASIGVVSAQITETKNITVSLNVSKILSFSVSNIALNTISPVAGATGTGTANIRTNYYSWSVSVYAQNGALTQWNSSTSSYISGGATIPYTFSFNDSVSTASQKIVNATLGTTLAGASVASFTNRTTGGTGGQAFTYKVTVPAATGTNDWDAGDYQDVIYMQVTVN